MALMVALIAVCSQLVIPFSGMPMTLQTFAVAFCGFFLGAKYGFLTLCVYLLAGAVGLPVFAGFGATGSLLGLSGGFLFGFLLLALSCGMGKNKSVRRAFAISLLGLFVCHAVGVLWYHALSGNPLLPSFLLVSLPFLIKDIISLFFAKILAKRVEKHL